MKASEECRHYLEGRIKFEKSWNVYDKMQWCRDTIDYVSCSNHLLMSCNISSQKTEADQLQSFIDYITKQSNLNCPGGINGCDTNTNDVRCRLGVRYFMGATFISKSSLLVHSNFVLIIFSHMLTYLFFIFLTWN